MSNALFPFGREIWTFGSAGSMMWRTDIVETYGGHEQRNRAWAAPRRRFVVDLRPLTAPQRDALVGFYFARSGTFESFLLRDETDPGSPIYRVRFESDDLPLVAETDPELWESDVITLIEVRD